MTIDALQHRFATVEHALEHVESLTRSATLSRLHAWLHRLELGLEKYLEASADLPFAKCEATPEVLWMLLLRLKDEVDVSDFEHAYRSATDLREELASYHRARTEFPVMKSRPQAPRVARP